MKQNRIPAAIRRALIATLLIGWTLPAVGEPADCPRIVSQSPYITHSLEWLGLGDCIVGVSRYDERDLPKTGGVMDPDLEAIALLDPELLLTSDWTDAKKWRAAAPPGAQALRLQGFGSVAEIENNLRRIGEAAGLEAGEERARAFAQRWRKSAEQLRGHGEALVVSACGGVPYSFGRRTYIYDLFATSGFQMVETHENIRHLKAGEKYRSLDALVAAFEPDWLFVLTRRDDKQCAALQPRRGVGVVGLDSELFSHPAPTLLKGLEQLVDKRERWMKKSGERR